MSSTVDQLDRPERAHADYGGQSIEVSVVLPVTERCDDLVEIYRSSASVLRQMGSAYEFIVVCDGRFSWAAKNLERLRNEFGEPIRVVVLPRTYGEATALAIGFELARGELLITLPSYFQTMPEGIESVLNLLNEGHDVVVVRRWPRMDPWLNRLQNYGFHRITHWLTGVALHDLGCGVKGLRKRVVREIQLYGDLHRFLPVLAYQRGFRPVEVFVQQHPNDRSLRIYRPGVYLRRFLDLLTLVFLFKFTKKPLRFFGLIGMGLFGLGITTATMLAIQRLLGLTALSDRPLLILGVLLMVLGVQVGSIGLLGELIIFTHARKMKDYAIEKVLK